MVHLSLIAVVGSDTIYGLPKKIKISKDDIIQSSPQVKNYRINHFKQIKRIITLDFLSNYI